MKSCSRVLGIFLLVCFLGLAACRSVPSPALAPAPVPPTATDEKEARLPEVIQVTEGVWVAIGFGLANSILLEGPEGVVVVDTLESAAAAEPVKKAFERISAKPLQAIIYTHNHADHVLGTKVFTGGRPLPIWAHDTMLRELEQTLNVVRPVIYKRSMRQFGVLLPEGLLLDAGIGPRLKFNRDQAPTLIRPNKTFSGKSISLELAGIKMELLHLPGETPDQIGIWLPEKKVLLPADNFYRAFPNLYAIRGTAYRDVQLWAQSLDLMRALGAEYLVPSHTRPVVGKQKIYETLTDYRDAIQFVHDQTVRGLNLGWTLEETVERVELPAHLAQRPYLQETYGTVAWSVRAVADGYLGWFDGNATQLFPLNSRGRAQRWSQLVDGPDKLKAAAARAAAAGDFQWAAELADLLLALDPMDQQVKDLKARALRELGLKQTSFNGRNYYLTQSLELNEKLTIRPLPLRDRDTVQSLPLESFFRLLAINLNPEKSVRVEQTVGFRFPDTGEAYTVHIRRGIAEMVPQYPKNPDFTITVDSRVWKEIVSGLRPAGPALLTEINTDAGLIQLKEFLELFKA